MKDSRTLHPEDQIAQYRVVGPLGAGGMGEVYLAQDQSLERSVALKVLPHELTRSDDRVRRFVQEARSASSLNHPNIVTIYEIGQEPVKSRSGEGDSGPLHYISMELISGKTLGAKIHEEKTDLKSLVGYLAQAAEGIAKAHAVGIIHRDLKPGNIMVSDDGFAKVLDFGLAKLTEKMGSAGPNEATEVVDHTTDGAIMGTVSYMSPEQVQGKPVDVRSDIFSFGSILYEAATRQRPFIADTNVEIMHKILHEKPRAVEELNAHAPAELRRVIRRCLSKAPEQRAQSMKDIAIELREIFDEYESLSSTATSATLTAGSLPAAKRRANLVPVLIAVSAIAVAAIAFGLFRGRKTAGPAQPFLTMRVNTQTNRGDVEDCALSPDGRFIAYVAGRANQHTLRVRQVATGSDVEILPVQDASIEFPSFTPDGNYIFYCKRKADAPSYRILMSVPSLGGAEQERGFDVDSRLAFSPDAKRACFVRNYPQRSVVALVMQDLSTGQQKEIASVAAPGSPVGSPWWSPDGRSIAVCIVSPPPRSNSVVALFDPDTGERRDFFTRKGAFFTGGLAGLPDGGGMVLAGFDLSSTLTNQLFLLTYPEGELRRVTNDFNNYTNVTAGGDDLAIASNRSTSMTNLYVIDSTSGEAPRPLTSTASPENSPFNIVVLGDRVYFGAVRGDFVGVSSVGLAGSQPTVYETGDGHVMILRSRSGRIVLWRIDADQQMHVWRMEPAGGMKQLTSGTGERLVDLSPDGKWFTYTVSDSTRGVWIMSTDGGEGRLVAPRAQPGIGSFSPDNQLVITLEYEADEKGFVRPVFKVTPIEGGEAVTTLRLPQRATDYEGRPGDGGAVTFIDNADPNRNVYVADIVDQAVRKVTQFTDGIITDHQWSDDGKRLAVVRRLPDGENVWILDRDGNKPVQATHFTRLDVVQVAWAPDNVHVVANAGQTSNDVVLVRNFR